MGLEVAERAVRGWFGVVGTCRGGIREGGGLARKRPEGAGFGAHRPNRARRLGMGLEATERAAREWFGVVGIRGGGEREGGGRLGGSRRQGLGFGT
jgi:hypothetical protein